MGPNQRRLLGEGVVPLAALLDALPPGLPLSVELPPPPGARPAAAEWAKTTAANVRGFLARYAQAGARA
jgi:hypothetical protein